MKSLLICIAILLCTLGCGGYGSGSMGTTAAPAPLFAPPSGTYNGPQQMITIADSLQGVTIYYTTDGTMPTLASPVYGGPFAITRSTRIQAIAARNGYSVSSVTIADYTLQ